MITICICNYILLFSMACNCSYIITLSTNGNFLNQLLGLEYGCVITHRGLMCMPYMGRKHRRASRYCGWWSAGPTFIKPDQLDPWIKDQLRNALLSTILSLPHDTKFGNCRGETVDRRVIFIWSLIHGSSWSGLIKVGPGEARCQSISWHFVDKHRPVYIWTHRYTD